MTVAIMECPVSHDNGPECHPTTTSNTDSIDPSKLMEIPQPPQSYLGLLGHVPDIDLAFPMSSFWKLMDLYGPIIQLNLGVPRVFLGSQELISELFDEDVWIRAPTGPVQELRAATGDGLFTAFLEEKNWWKAHRLLVPAFGMFDPGPVALDGSKTGLMFA